MQFTMPQQQLEGALRTVERAVSTRNTIPVLSGIHLRASRGQLSLRATDLEVDIATAVPAQLGAEGEAVVTGRQLVELVRHLPDGLVHVVGQPENHTARLSVADTEFVLHGFPPDQFPAWIGAASGPSAALSPDALRRCLRETGFALGNDPARPWISGVFLQVQEQQLVAMATDQAVVAYSETEVANPSALAFSVILPGRTVQELERLLADSQVPGVDIRPVHNQLCFSAGSTVVTSRLLEGQFPDFRRVLPQSYRSTILLSRSALVAAAERVTLLARDGRMRIDGAEAGLKLTAQAPEVGWIADRVPGALTGEPFRTQLNVRYLLQGLRHFADETIAIDYSGPRTAVRVRPASDRPAFFAVMPLIEF